MAGLTYIVRIPKTARPKKYWYYLASPSLVLDRPYPSDTLALSFLFRELTSHVNSRPGGPP